MAVLQGRKILVTVVISPLPAQIASTLCCRQTHFSKVNTGRRQGNGTFAVSRPQFIPPLMQVNLVMVNNTGTVNTSECWSVYLCLNRSFKQHP